MQHSIRRGVIVVIVVALVVPLLAACGQPAAQPQGGEPTGTITASGAFALYPMMVKWGEEYQKPAPECAVRYFRGRRGQGHDRCPGRSSGYWHGLARDQAGGREAGRLLGLGG